MIEFQVINVALDSMNREHKRMRQASDRIASSNIETNGTSKTGFSQTLNGTTETGSSPATEQSSANSAGNTIDEITTIMSASRMYDANVSVISAARSAFEKALEISGRR